MNHKGVYDQFPIFYHDYPWIKRCDRNMQYAENGKYIECIESMEQIAGIKLETYGESSHEVITI